MSDLPWFPFYVSRFLGSRRVRRMSTEQIGIYLLLLCEQWEGGAIPNNDADLVRFTNTSASNARTVLQQCFSLTSEGWLNPELVEIQVEQEVRRDKRVSAGSKGGTQKAANRLAMLEAEASNALAIEKKRVEEKKEIVIVGGGKKNNYPEAFEAWWLLYPRREGGNPKKPCLPKWKQAVKEVGEEKLTSAVTTLRRYHESKREVGTPHVPQALTWLNQARWEDALKIEPLPPDRLTRETLALWNKGTDDD